MYRYVAFTWNPAMPAESALAAKYAQLFRWQNPTWEFATAGSGLTVFHSHPTDPSYRFRILPAGTGVILGTLFPIDLDTWSPTWNPTISESLAEAMVRTSGKRLTQTFWGSYVAMLGSRDGANHFIVRECSGHIPCYALELNGINIIFSNIEDLGGLSLPRFHINARFFAAFVANPEASVADSALKEVQEVLAGHCLELNDKPARQIAIWNPQEICSRRQIEDFGKASTLLRSITQSCIDAWASRYDRILHRLSGGLDSAIVLGCLSKSRSTPAVTCFTVYGNTYEGDERYYARLAATRARVELIEQQIYSDEAQIDDQVFLLPKSPKPSVLHVFTFLNLERQNEVVTNFRAQSIWDGQGGDHFFCQGSNPWGAVDFVRHHGLVPSFLGPLRDSVKRSKKSYWEVLNLAIRLGLLRGKWSPQDMILRRPMFVNPEVVPEDFDRHVWHPWSDAADMPIGKRFQAALIADLLNRHRPIPGIERASERHPLLSQPIMELCLQIPTYTLLQGGTDRALARSAYADCVPVEILAREAKGTINTSLTGKLRQSQAFLQSLLLNGVLIREGILERKTLEPYLLAARPTDIHSWWPLLGSISAEVWAQQWESSDWRIPRNADAYAHAIEH